MWGRVRKDLWGVGEGEREFVGLSSGLNWLNEKFCGGLNNNNNNY